MNTLDFATLGVEELTNQEMINNNGGGDSSLIAIGSITVGNLLDVNAVALLNGNLFCGNSTDLNANVNLKVWL